MNEQRKSIEALIKIEAPEITLSAKELKAANTVANNYVRTYLVPFNRLQRTSDETFKFIRNRVINLAIEYHSDKRLIDAIDCMASPYQIAEGVYTNLVHAMVEEERAIIAACKNGMQEAFTYMFLLMGHKVTTFIYENCRYGYKYVGLDDLASELLIELYNVCCSFSLEKNDGGIGTGYLRNQLKHFYRDQIMGKNDVICCSGRTKQRINKALLLIESECDIDGKIGMTSDEIKAATDVRSKELLACYIERNTMSFDSKDGIKEQKLLLDPTSDFSNEEDVCDDELCFRIAKAIHISEEEINELLRALIQHVEEYHVKSNGKVRKFSRRNLYQFCKAHGNNSVNYALVTKVLSEYAFQKTGRRVAVAK